MLLAIDLGNTNLTFGLFQGERLVHDWRLATRRDSMPDELGISLLQLIRQEGLDPKAVEAVVVASVVPPLNTSLVEAVRRYFGREPLMVEPGIKSGMKILYRDPKEVGADRIVAALAAFRKYGGPLIIIDFGTGTTYDAISREGDYLGGAIAPGMGSRSMPFTSGLPACSGSSFDLPAMSSAGPPWRACRPGSSSVSSRRSRGWSPGCARSWAPTLG